MSDQITKICKVIKNINKNSYNYGNETFYVAADFDVSDENYYKRLEGLFWIIGRSYAASPERRSYGKSTILNVDYFKKEGYIDNSKKTMPRWPVKSSGDGLGSFFDKLIEYLKKDHDKELKELFGKLKGKTYRLDYSEDDMKLMINAIKCVAELNRLIKSASEEFDEVPVKNEGKDFPQIDEKYLKEECKNEKITVETVLQNNKMTEKTIHVKNQISFCSKFLHFRFPDTVFIIDQYSYRGGRQMMTKNKSSQKGWELCEIGMDEDLIKKLLDKAQENVKKESIKNFINGVKALIPSNEKASNLNESEENYNLKDYINHCLNAYAFCCFAKKQNINPADQVLYLNQNLKINSYPRLADSVFMNVKSISDKTVENNQKLLGIYKEMAGVK